MSRARGQSPVSARPLLAELSDLVADLGMEAPGAPLRQAPAEHPRLDSTTAVAVAAPAEAAPDRRSAPARSRTARRPGRSAPETGGDPWTDLELALAAAGEARSLTWP